MSGSWRAAAAAGLLFMMAPALALAEDAAGDWLGVVKTPEGDKRLALHFRRDAAGAWTGSGDSLDEGIRNLKLEAIVATADSLAFKGPAAAGGTFQGRWDPAAGKWVGTWTQQGSSLPMEFARGVAPPEPPPQPSPVVAGLDGDWEGVLEPPGRKVRLILHVATTPALGTKARLDSPDQGVEGIPVAAVTRDGTRVALDVKTVSASFQGDLDTAGRVLTGQWIQSQGALPLVLTRR